MKHTLLPDEKALLAVTNAITAQFASTANVDKLILSFRKTTQNKGEGVVAYVMRLRLAAVGCNFEGNLEQELKLQLAIGATNPKVHLKAIGAVQTWAELYAHAKALETGAENKRAVGIPVDRPIKVEFSNALTRAKSPTTERAARCGYCDRARHERGERCPAKGKQCTNCGMQNHFKEACRQPPRSQFARSSSPLRNKKQCNQITASHGRNEGGQSPPDNECYHMFAVHKRAQVDGGLPRATVDILGTNIDMGIHSQASVNAINSEQYEAMVQKPELREWQDVAYSFDGTKPLKAVGAYAKVNGRSAALEFIVFAGVNSNLLGYRSCVQLGLLPELNKQVHQLTGETSFSKNVKRQYPTLFTGRIGKLPGVELKLHIDQSIAPAYEAHRKIAYRLRDKVEAELRKMEEDDIIEDAIGPSGWVSKMVIVPKQSNPDEIRITIDSKKANKAILRVRHNTPTIEDLAIELNGAKLLSKLDLRGGFHQIVLHPDSRNINGRVLRERNVSA